MIKKLKTSNLKLKYFLRSTYKCEVCLRCELIEFHSISTHPDGQRLVSRVALGGTTRYHSGLGNFRDAVVAENLKKGAKFVVIYLGERVSKL